MTDEGVCEALYGWTITWSYAYCPDDRMYYDSSYTCQCATSYFPGLIQVDDNTCGC